jgi:DNA polymerase-1
MIQIFLENRDIHREAAAAAMRVASEKISSDQRQVGKTLNFATGYGAGAAKIAAVAGVSQREGQKFLDRYYDQFPRLKPWKNAVLKEARGRGDRADILSRPPSVVIPPIGRLRRLPDLYNPVDGLRWYAERQAINALIQGLASNITKQAMIDLHAILPEYGAHMVVQVHDEIVVRVPEARVDEVLHLVTSTMSSVKDLEGKPILGRIPLVASAGVGYTWADAKG